ncbi:hypothetical protein BDR06DRAFT_981635 [Suillus hirtellus]|nr:hypothetical protein BDR06DRAFT_981635 [Suillus hirtellus]
MHDPDTFVSVDQLSNFYSSSRPNAELSSNPEVASSSKPPSWPWKNMSIWRLMTWMLTESSQTSHAQAMQLVNEVLLAEDFQIEDIKGFNAHTEMKCWDSSEAQLDNNDIYRRDGWKEMAAEILVPTQEKNPNRNGQPFMIPGFRYWPLTAVIHATFSEATSKWFHFTPFKHFWKSPVTGQEQYDSCKLEKVIAGLMFWSDSMHLAQFGNASAWPLYLYFRNQSKYTCSCPTSDACHHVAFIPMSYHDILAHCKHEMFRAIWHILIDDDFLDAYRNGIIIKCHDGVYCQVFPRIFTYSADYPEKVLITAIHDKGVCPCPWCLLPKSLFGHIGLRSDMVGRVARVHRFIKGAVVTACNAIYNLGTPIKGAAIEHLLKESSLMPTINTFAEQLGPFGFDCFSMLVVNLLHEFELGVFKSVFKHLIRLLYAINPEWIGVLNEW